MDAIGLSNLPRQLIDKNVVNMILEGDVDSSWSLLKCLYDLRLSAPKLVKQSIIRNQDIIKEQPIDEKQKVFYSNHNSDVLSLPVERKEGNDLKFPMRNGNLNVAHESLKNTSIFVSGDQRWSAKLNVSYNIKTDNTRFNGDDTVSSRCNKENDKNGLQSRNLIDGTEKEVCGTLDPSNATHSSQVLNGPSPPLLGLKNNIRNFPQSGSSSVVMRDFKSRNNVSSFSNIKNSSNINHNNSKHNNNNNGNNDNSNKINLLKHDNGRKRINDDRRNLDNITSYNISHYNIHNNSDIDRDDNNIDNSNNIQNGSNIGNDDINYNNNNNNNNNNSNNKNNNVHSNCNKVNHHNENINSINSHYNDSNYHLNGDDNAYGIKKCNNDLQKKDENWKGYNDNDNRNRNDDNYNDNNNENNNNNNINKNNNDLYSMRLSQKNIHRWNQEVLDPCNNLKKESSGIDDYFDLRFSLQNSEKNSEKSEKIESTPEKNRNFHSVNILDFSDTEVLENSKIGNETDPGPTDFMNDNIENTEKTMIFHPRTEKKIILQWLRKLGIHTMTTNKSGIKVQGQESGMKVQDPASMKLLTLDLKDEWENGVMLCELCALLNPLGKEENKKVCTYDRRGHLMKSRLVIAGSEVNVRSRAQVFFFIFFFCYVFFISY